MRDQPAESVHSFCGDVADVGDAGVGDGDILGINEIDRGGVGGVAVEAGGGIDIQGGAYDQHNVGGGDDVYGLLDVRDGLAEKDDVRAELTPVRSLVAEMNLVVADVDDLFL